MLYKFKSRATSDLIMLEPHGRRLLQIVGKSSDDHRGILRPEDVPQAIAALEAAVAEDEARRRALEEEARANGRDPSPADSVSLRQRATPFIEMLRRSAQAGREVVWGV